MKGYWSRPAGDIPRAVDWAGVAIFYVVALIWSAVAAHWSMVQIPGSIAGSRIDDSLVCGFGPAVGALAARLARPAPPAAATMLGRRPGWIVLAMIAPIMWLALFGMTSRTLPGDARVHGFIFAASVVLYCVGEEIGWRGYLFDALAGQPLWRSTAITAALWYGWHWTFLADTLRQPQGGIGFAIGLLLGSVGLGAAVRRTRATGIAVAWHAAVKTLGVPAQIACLLATVALANWVAGRDRR